jgi:recombination DNA repair RAD52 pathway protein
MRDESTAAMTQHSVHPQGTGLTPLQIDALMRPLDSRRVAHDNKGMSYLEAWDIRRHLIRTFGYGGWTIDTLALDLVREIEHAEDRPRYTVVYRAQVRLTIYDTHGAKVAHFDDGAAGDASRQPSLGDAHDLAMKTALSQAVKRCAVNLGDMFGLSLYNNGSADPVVLRSLAHEARETTQDNTTNNTSNMDGIEEKIDSMTVPALRKLWNHLDAAEREALGPAIVARVEHLTNQARESLRAEAKAAGVSADGLNEGMRQTHGAGVAEAKFEHVEAMRQVIKEGAAS